MRTVLNQYQQAAEIPLLIGVDEEGGNVNRVSLYKAFRAAPFHSCLLYTSSARFCRP